MERLLNTYIAQVLLAAIISGLFYYFSKNYNRPFLIWWFKSWLFYALVYVASAILMVSSEGYRSMASFVIIVSSYLQLLYLFFGLIEYIYNDKVRTKTHLTWLVVIIVFSFLSYFLFYSDPELANYRYLIRVGLKANVIGMGYGILAFMLIKNRAFIASFGRFFLTGAFILYALQQLWHASIVYLNFSGRDTPFPMSTYGIIDLFSLAVIGLGMIIWMLEMEHKKLDETNKELDSFLYSTSHDLRAPIASILGLTNLARLETKDQAAIDYIERIENRVKKLDEIFGDILNYSKSTKRPIELKKVLFHEAVETALSKIKFLSKDIRIIIDKTPYQLTVDPYQLDIILNNLLTNAFKYSDENKEERWIKIAIDKIDGRTKIFIEDNGIGIDPEAHARVFDMFYRATTNAEGSGLGLYIANEAAKKMGGKISVKSYLGEGSEFTVEL